MVCAVFDDRTALEIAKTVKMKPGGVAEKHLEKYLKGKGGIEEVDLSKWWRNNKRIREKVVSRVLNSFLQSGIKKDTIPLNNGDFDDKEWWYALGRINLEYEITNVEKRQLSANLFFQNMYDWHPEEKSSIQCLHEAANRLKNLGARDFLMKGNTSVKIPVPKFELQPFKASNFTGSSIYSDPLFFPALERINDYAKKSNIKIFVTHSFRANGQKITGTVVSPASKSNHLVGHAIDFNISLKGKLYKSKDLKKSNSGNWPNEIKGFIDSIKNDKELRWGGEFNDPVHIDIPLNLKDKKLWEDRFKLLQ